MGSSPSPASSSVALRSPFNANPLFFPNLPVPVNGMIRTYENPNRSFQRPYSAKTVFFYKDGDHYFTVSLDVDLFNACRNSKTRAVKLRFMT